MLEWCRQAYKTVDAVYPSQQPKDRPVGKLSSEVDWNIDTEETRAAGDALSMLLLRHFTEPESLVTEEEVRQAWRSYYKLHLRTWSGVTPVPGPEQQKEINF